MTALLQPTSCHKVSVSKITPVKEKGNHIDVEVSLHTNIHILVIPQICLLQVLLWLLGLHIHPSKPWQSSTDFRG